MNSLSNQFATMGKRRPVITASDITNGLVGWWKFNEGSGTTAADSSGNGFAGTLYNSPAWTTGPNGTGAISLDGSSQAVDCGDIDALDGLSAITVSAWAKCSGDSGSRVIVSKKRNGFPGWSLNNSSINLRASFQLYTDGGNATVTTDAFSSGTDPASDGLWHFYSATYNGAEVTFFFDGVENGTPASLTGNLVSNAYRFNIGANYNNSVGAFVNFWSGGIDDVRIYNRALSSTEIATLYANGAK